MKTTISWVYFVQLGTSGPVKIGTAVNVRQRLASLQSGTIETLRLLAVIPGGREIERQLHAQFSELRLRGEWFEFGPAIADIVDKADYVETRGLKAQRAAARAPEDVAKAAWTDKSLTVEDALDRMPGWTFPAAYSRFGRRGVPFPNISEHASRMAKKRWEHSPKLVERWNEPNMAREKERWGQHWRDPKFRSGAAALAKMPKKLRDEFVTTKRMYAVFGPRDPSGSKGGRPAKRKPK